MNEREPESSDKFVYHGGACVHPACQLRTLQLDIARAKSRQRHERPKTKIDFDPFTALKGSDDSKARRHQGMRHRAVDTR